MINVGNKDIDSVYFGSKAVDSVYLGPEKVWPEESEYNGIHVVGEFAESVVEGTE